MIQRTFRCHTIPGILQRKKLRLEDMRMQSSSQYINPIRSNARPFTGPRIFSPRWDWETHQYGKHEFFLKSFTGSSKYIYIFKIYDIYIYILIYVLLKKTSGGCATTTYFISFVIFTFNCSLHISKITQLLQLWFRLRSYKQSRILESTL